MAEKKWNPDDPKYNALKRVLLAHGRDIDEEIVAHLETLCKELAVGSDQPQVAEFPEDSYAVFHFFDSNESFCFTSSDYLTLYDSGRLYTKIVNDGHFDRSFDTLAYEYYGVNGTTVINEVLFSSLAKAMAVDDRITAAIEYDFDNYEVTMYERDGETVKRYDLDDFAEAVEESGLALVNTRTERNNCLLDLLQDQEIKPSDLDSLTMPM